MATLDVLGIDTTTGKTKRWVSGDSINGAVTGSFTATQIPYATGSTSLTSTSSFVWDNTNVRLGVGISTPNFTIHAHSTSVCIAQFTNTDSGSTSVDGLIIGINPTTPSAFIWNYESQYMYFGTSNTERMRILTNGDVTLGAGGAGSFYYEAATGELALGTAGFTTPVRTLHLHASTPIIKFSSATTGSATGDGADFGSNGDGSSFIWVYENQHTYFGTNNTERLRILADGNITHFTGNITLANDPTSALHAVTKQYVDNLTLGLSWKDAADAGSSAKLDDNATISGSPSWTEPQITATLLVSGTFIVDGVTLATNDRLLVKNEGDSGGLGAAANGLYKVTISGTALTLDRTTDMDSWLEVPDASVFIVSGTVNDNSGWVCTSDEGGTLGTTAITWSQFAGSTTYTADGNGIELVGNQFQLELDGSTLSKSATGLKVADLGIANAQVATAAAITRSKLATGTNNAVVFNSGTGVMTDSANLIFDSTNSVLTASHASYPRILAKQGSNTGFELSQASTGNYLWGYDAKTLEIAVNNQAYWKLQSDGRSQMGTLVSNQTVATLQLRAWSVTADDTLRIKLLSSQTGKLLNFVNTSDTVLSYVDTSGEINLNAQKRIKFYDSDSSNFVGLQAPGTVSSDITFTLPSADGTVGQILKTDGSLNLSFVTVEEVLSETTGIDGKTATTTNLYTVPSGKTALITKAIIEITTATGLTGTLVAGIGVAAGEDDIFGSTTMTGLDTTSEMHVFAASGTTKKALSTEVVKLGIDTAFGGTTVTLSVTLIGYLK